MHDTLVPCFQSADGVGLGRRARLWDDAGGGGRGVEGRRGLVDCYFSE